MKMFYLEENGLFMVWGITPDGDVRLLHFSSTPLEVTDLPGDEASLRLFRLVEVIVSGENQQDHHGSKYSGTAPGMTLRYAGHSDYHTEAGRKLEITMVSGETGLQVTSHFAFTRKEPVVRVWTELCNKGKAELGLEYISSFALSGIAKEGEGDWDRKMVLQVPHNAWYGECQWRTEKLHRMGLSYVNDYSVKRLAFNSTGTWSSSQYLPMGYVENTETGAGWIWQIEHNGSWHWELADMRNDLYLQLSGPTENEGHWWRKLAPGESFTSIPAAVGVSPAGWEAAIGAMTGYRREIRRPNRDNLELPVIFNDYMNCLFGDPTTEKLLPLIDAAAAAGCEVFCIDCGWYSDGPWWDGVGEWLPSRQRFPNGIGEITEAIRTRGMIPGLWLELEVMGIHCPLAAEVPDDWFFIRHGRRVMDRSRYQLDFRNPQVRAHAQAVVQRVVEEYGAGYIKMDYNINAGIGTELHADSFGDGLLQHNRAYLQWLDGIFAQYPDLIIENCGSGGMRMDYALLARHSIQSTSDQTDYRRNAVIAAASSSAATPEQCAVWSYPLRDGSAEETAFNMVNAMLMRIHQSGHLAELEPGNSRLVAEGIEVYKTIRSVIPASTPFWPLGLPHFEDGWISFGLNSPGRMLLAVWRLSSEVPECVLPLPGMDGKEPSVRLLYPAQLPGSWSWSVAGGRLSVVLPETYSARLFEVSEEHSN